MVEEHFEDSPDWLEHCRQFWEEKLDLLEEYLRDLQLKEKEDGPRK
jgi:hypothetical protein